MDTPCPYLSGQRERKLMTEIQGRDAVATYSRLSRAGFRRSHNYAYRPACGDCDACIPVRVRAEDFVPGDSLRRVRRLNESLAVQDRPAAATKEQYALFARYLRSRHGDGEMAGMTYTDYRMMVGETRLNTHLTEFREPGGQLVAACLTDWLEDGPSAVYSFFEPDLAKRSLGTFMVLWLIESLDLDDRGHIPIYVGDDDTDEDAFRALRGRGLGILVGEASQVTGARFHLATCGEVYRFLHRLRDSVPVKS